MTSDMHFRSYVITYWLCCLCHSVASLPGMKAGYGDVSDELPRADDHQEMTMTSICCWQALNRAAYAAWC